MSPASFKTISTHRRPGGGGGGGGGLSFLGQTNWARPTPGTPAAAQAAGWNLRPFTTLAGLKSLVAAGVANHDYLYYNATNPSINNTSTSTPVLTLDSINPSIIAAIDLGCSNDYWDPTKVSNGYLGMTSTATSQMSTMLVRNCSNLAIYGGDIQCDRGYGIELDGPIDNVTMWDQYVHHVGGSGLWARDYYSGITTHIRNSSFRMEVNRFCLYPATDSHLDKGTGHHGFLLHGNTGEQSGNTYVCYAHDPLRPGEVSFGVAYPEGSGGACIEPGNNATSSTALANNIYYALGVNLLMQPDGSNPGSGGNKQAGGNVIECWGSAPMNNNIFGWIEGINCTGGVFHGVSAGWNNVSSPIIVQHGRHTNTNQFTLYSQSGANALPFNKTLGIQYQDIDA